MKFPEGFFEGEYREDFYIEPMMKRNWASQMEVLNKISDLCEKYQISYFALWGTLLGAIRHKGYIPWDDDLDIGMLREDYDKFFEIAKKELPIEYKILNIYDEPKWDLGIGRITNSDGIILSERKLKIYHGCPFAVGVDIFPYDPIPDDADTRKHQENMMDLINKVKAAVKAKYDETGDKSPEVLDEAIIEGLSYIENKYGFTFNKEAFLVNQLDCLYDQISATTAPKESTYVTCYMEKLKRKTDFKMPTFWLSETINVPFETSSIKVPKYYEAVLAVCYGLDFMTPIKTGISGHDYPSYGKQIKFMKEHKFDKIYEKIMLLYEEDYSCDKYVLPYNKFLTMDIKNSSVSRKKSLLYCVGISDVYLNEEAIVNKIGNTISMILKYENEIDLYFTINPMIADLLYWKDEKLLYKLNEILGSIDEEKIICIDYDRIVDNMGKFDAYYGTQGEMVKYFTANGKPVMIQNFSLLNSESN